MPLPRKRVSPRRPWWLLALLLTAGAPPPEPGEAPDDALSGGSTTVFDVSQNAFGRALANLERTRWPELLAGKAVFMKTWEAWPAGPAGPLLNATGCGACHFKDGRGRPLPELGDEAPLLVRLSTPAKQGLGPGPAYGGQLHDRAVPGVHAEGTVAASYTEVPGRYADGTAYTLRKPRYRATGLGYGPLAPGTLLSPRIPSPVFGLGLLEAIPEEAILALADPGDANGDGISGRPNRVHSVRTGALVLGRLGWKASQPSVEQQAARAQASEPELTAHQLESTTLYLRLLAVPARRDTQAPQVRQGQALFQQVGCASCHHPAFKTGDVADLPELSRQDIRPYTDLLLHDLGPDLADGRPGADASGAEWRTPPLWGLGLLEAVNRQVRMLHDGRARGFEEAILWHGGEAAAARERFRSLQAPEREALLAFLRSL